MLTSFVLHCPRSHRAFASFATEQLDELATRHEEFEKNFATLAADYGDDAEKVSYKDLQGTEAFFAIISTFVDEFLRAHQQNELIKQVSAPDL